MVGVPPAAYRQIPAEPLAGKIVIDTTNYLPDRDGHIAGLADQSITTSQLLQAHLPASHVVKALNAVCFEHLATLARPHGATGRSAVPIAGDDETAQNTVTAFLDVIGYDAYDVGPLSEGWRFQAGAIADAYSTDGSFDHPRLSRRPVTAAGSCALSVWPPAAAGVGWRMVYLGGLLAAAAGCRLAWWALVRRARRARGRGMMRWSSGLLTAVFGCS